MSLETTTLPEVKQTFEIDRKMEPNTSRNTADSSGMRTADRFLFSEEVGSPNDGVNSRFVMRKTKRKTIVGVPGGCDNDNDDDNSDGVVDDDDDDVGGGLMVVSYTKGPDDEQLT